MVAIESKPCFVAKDVLTVLGLKGFSSVHAKRLDQGEVLHLKRDSQLLKSSDRETLFESKSPVVTVVSESGLNRLALRSNKAEAKVEIAKPEKSASVLVMSSLGGKEMELLLNL